MQRSKIEQTDDTVVRLNMKCWARIFISAGGAYYFCQVRTPDNNVWWRNDQGILGVGNRHDNIDPSFYYCAYTNTKCVERDQKSGYYNHTKNCVSSRKR